MEHDFTQDLPSLELMEITSVCLKIFSLNSVLFLNVEYVGAQVMLSIYKSIRTINILVLQCMHF